MQGQALILKIAVGFHEDMAIFLAKSSLVVRGIRHLPLIRKLLQLRIFKCAQSKDLLLADRSSIPFFSESPKTRFSRATGRSKCHRRAGRGGGGECRLGGKAGDFRICVFFRHAGPVAPGIAPLAPWRCSGHPWTFGPRPNNETL